MTNKEPGLDVEGRLREYFPIFFELLGENKLEWKAVTKSLSRKIAEWKAKAKGETIRVKASFFNIITAAIEGNEEAKSHLEFIQKLFEELIIKLNSSERKLVVRALSGLLTNVDQNFRNFLGELLVLNAIKRNPKLQLIEVEVPVIESNPNGPKLDFKFKNLESQSELLIEVVNVHLNDVAEWTDDRVNHLLHEKIQHKLNVTGIKQNEGFGLMVVFWGEFTDIVRMDRYYREQKPSFKNTFEPVSFLMFTMKDGKKLHLFGTITSLIDTYKNWPSQR